MDNRRIIINLSLPFFLFFIRWFIVAIGQKVLPMAFKKPTSRFDATKTVAQLGWEFAGVGLGFYLSALLSPDSALEFWRNDGADVGSQNLRVILSFSIFMALYFGAIFVRFCLLESWRDLEVVHRCLYGLASWVLSFVILGATSALAVKAGTPTSVQPLPAQVVHHP